MIKGTMNTTTNLFIFLIVTLFIFPATAIRYAQAQPGCEGDSCEPTTAPQEDNSTGNTTAAAPQENNNTGNTTSTGGSTENNNTGNTASTGVPENTTTPSGLPPPATDNSSGSKPPATTANSPTSPQTCDSPNNCPSPEEQDSQHRLQSGVLQHRFDYGRPRCEDREGDDRGDCDSSGKIR